MDSKVYKNSIKNLLIVLNLLQINVFAKNRTNVKKLLSIFNYIFLITGTMLPLIRFLQLDEKNISYYAKDVIYICGFTQTSLKTGLFIFYQKDLMVLYTWAKSMYTAKYNENTEKLATEVLDEGAKYVKMLVNIMTMAYNVTILVIASEAFLGDGPWSVLAYLPGVQSKLCNIFYQLFVIFIAIDNALCFDLIFFIFVAHIYIKLTIICKILEMLDNDEIAQYLKSRYKIDEILIEIHILYNDVINIMNVINTTFEYNIVILFLTNMPLVCISVFFIISEPHNVNGYLIVFTCTAQIFVYSVFGHLIDTKVEMVAKLTYCTKWYELSIGQQKSIKILLIMVQKGCHLSGIFFELSLASFVSVVKAAVSYAAMINSL